MFRDLNIKPLVAAMIAASLLSACGGGGGGGDNPPAQQPGTGTGTGTGNDGGGTGGGGTGGQDPVVDAQRTTMYCFEGTGYQCTGETVLRTDHGVVMTNSGVQVAARSTSDLNAANPSATAVTGMNLLDSGKADIRVGKGSDRLANAVTMLLSDLGIRWGADDGVQRPLIVETFATTSGRYELTNNVARRVALPLGSDRQFYDLVTQANYANNVYYPKNATTNCTVSAETPLPADCETRGLFKARGAWRDDAADARPDTFSAMRLHNDGDVHAGENAPDPTPNGVPFPGSKGYRSIDGRSYDYANLSSWVSQDTVKMVEWNPGGRGEDEHNTQRRGVVAFGDVTDPAAVPTVGTATYTGRLYGYLGANGGTAEPEGIEGRATITVDFATGAATVAFEGVVSYAGTEERTLEIRPALRGGEAGTKFTNYLTGAFDGTNYGGGISARYFGPVVSTGASGSGPAEIAGTLRLTAKSGNNTFVGGFIARKD